MESYKAPFCHNIKRYSYCTLFSGCFTFIVFLLERWAHFQVEHRALLPNSISGVYPAIILDINVMLQITILFCRMPPILLRNSGEKLKAREHGDLYHFGSHNHNFKKQNIESYCNVVGFLKSCCSPY